MSSITSADTCTSKSLLSGVSSRGLPVKCLSPQRWLLCGAHASVDMYCMYIRTCICPSSLSSVRRIVSIGSRQDYLHVSTVYVYRYEIESPIA